MEIVIRGDSFEPIPEEERQPDEAVRPNITYWQDARRRFAENIPAVISLGFIVAIVICAVVIPIIKPDYYSNHFEVANIPPNTVFWFGTDKFGRDIFTRIWFGARYSLTIAFTASFINFLIGVVYGGVAGFLGGKTDLIMMRFVDAIYSVPMVIYAILFIVFLGAGLQSIIFAIAVSYWIPMARIVRGEILQLKQQEFVLAARALGAANKRIFLKHLLPNCMGQIIVTLTLLIPSAIFTEAFLSFIGLGIQPPRASWGTLASEGATYLRVAPYQLIAPALAISVTILAFNLFGDGLRDALDPQMRK